MASLGSGHLCLYEQVAAHIRHLIQEGALQSGDRIPSVRKLHRQQSVSISTVLEAYRLLEDQGWIVARPQSGYYVKAHCRTEIPEPAAGRSRSIEPVEVSLAYQVSSTLQNPQMIQLGAAVPDGSLFPSTALNRLMGRLLREEPTLVHRYDVPPGSDVLRQAVVRRLLDAGCTLSPEELVVTNGTTEALYLALKAVTVPGDAIVIESPTYYSLLELLNTLNLKAIELPASPQQGIDLSQLERTLQQHTIAACVLVSNFSNPLGYLMSDAKKQHLLALLTQYAVPLVEDDIYGELSFEGKDLRPKAIKAFDHKDQVIYCGSVSKTLSPGMRVGWCAPGRYLQQIKQLKLAMNIGTPLLPQLTVAAFLKNGGCDRHLRQLRRAYQSQIVQMTQAIQTYFPANTKISRPKGGFLLWVELPESIDALVLHQEALAHNISIAPGSMFSPSGLYRNYIRLNCGLPWSPNLEQTMIKLGAMLHSPTVLTANARETEDARSF